MVQRTSPTQTPTSSSLNDAYARARDSALLVRHGPPGVIRVSGADHQDFLHRMSTQELLGQPVGTIRPSVLTTPIARVVDAIQIARTADALWLLTSPGQAERVRAWLKGYIFFRDRVELGVDEGPIESWGVYGPAWKARLASAIPGALGLSPGEFLESGGGLVWAVGAPAGGGARLVMRRIPDSLRDSGSADPASLAAYEALRIEAGIPAFGAEIQLDSNPLDVGLEAGISFSKGCYIGQEILARMESRGVRARQLVGVHLAAEIHAPQPLRKGTSEVGDLTSTAWSPERGWIGLAVVKSAVADEADVELIAGEAGVAARVVALPMA